MTDPLVCVKCGKKGQINTQFSSGNLNGECLECQSATVAEILAAQNAARKAQRLAYSHKKKEKAQLLLEDRKDKTQRKKDARKDRRTRDKIIRTGKRNDLRAKHKIVREQAYAEEKNRKIRTKTAITKDSSIKDELIRRELSRRRLLLFIKRFYPGYEAGWVHHDICKRLEVFMEAVENGENPRLMLFMPPRHGKSHIASHFFPAYLLGHHPEWEIIAASYSASLPIGFSRKVRTMLKDIVYQKTFMGTRMDPDNQNAEGWQTTAGGGYRPAGVGGGITGMGANVLIIDDPIKDAEEADSETIREKVFDWYSSTAYTRLAPKSGVLIIQCMTGDTSVLMGDGTQRRLDAVQPGDKVATYAEGDLSVAKVLKHRSNGYDDVFALRTSSGTVVRANERHPFLIETSTGERKWIRLGNLKLHQRIVALKDSGVSGEGRYVHRMDVKRKFVVEGSAHHITTSGNGVQGIGPLQHFLQGSEKLISSIGMVSPLRFTEICSKSKTVVARCAGYLKRWLLPLITGSKSCVLTTATRQVSFAGCCATTATCYSSEETPRKYLSLHFDTGDFTTQGIVSIDYVGKEEVFDIEVEGTHNFIANNLVTHNTRWHDDDLSGRLLYRLKEAKKEAEELRADGEERLANAILEEVDDWEVVSYPAMALTDEFLSPDGKVIAITQDEGDKLLRYEGEALHEARFPLKRLKTIKRTIAPRHWSALYQQNPVPDDGLFFTKDMLRYRVSPDHRELPILMAWDLAIGQKQQNDWTVGIVACVDHENNVHVLDLIRGKWDTFAIVEAILNTYERFQTTGQKVVGIERGALDLAIRPQLKLRMRQRKLYPVFDEELRPVTDKIVRARPIQGRMQHGSVFFPPISSSPWVDTATSEMLRFPGGLHDDIVDAMAWVGRMLVRIEAPRAKGRQKKLPSWKDKISKYVDRGRGRKSAMSA